MLRRCHLPRRPYILNLHRRASRHSPSNPERDPRTALLASLYAKGFMPAPPERYVRIDKAKGDEFVTIVDRQGQRRAVNLRDIEPFKGDFRYLPLDLRTYIEKRELLDTLKKRLQAEYAVDTTPLPPPPRPQVPVKDVKKQIRRLILEWKMDKGDVLPNPDQFQQLVAHAKKRAAREFYKERSQRTGGGGRKPLTWEQQWRRGSAYSMRPPLFLFQSRLWELISLFRRQKYYKALVWRIHGSLFAQSRLEGAHMASKRYH